MPPATHLSQSPGTISGASRRTTVFGLLKSGLVRGPVRVIRGWCWFGLRHDWQTFRETTHPSPFYAESRVPSRRRIGNPVRLSVATPARIERSPRITSDPGQRRIWWTYGMRSRRSLPARVPLLRGYCSRHLAACRPGNNNRAREGCSMSILPRVAPTATCWLRSRGAGGLRPLARTRFVRSVSQGQRPRLSLRTPSLMQRVIRGRSCASLSSNDLMHHIAKHIRQPHVTPAEAVGQLSVFDTEEVQNCGV